MKNEETDIRSVRAFYNLTVKAENMKKAYDIAVQYLPVGSEIENIDLDRRCGTPEPF